VTRDRVEAAAYAGRPSVVPLPKTALPHDGLDAKTAYRLIHDELLLDGSSRLNLATFVTTWMEPEADRLMAESFDKNMIDKDEYPQTAELERRCVSMVANLFHAPGAPVGVSTIGSSEAVMLAGLALKNRWRARRRLGPFDAQRPNLVLGTDVQVVWEKFCRYWDVEPRYIPVQPGRYTVTPEEVMARVDDDTIGVVAILGTTFTGEYEPIHAIHEALERHNATAANPVPIHVDAASGGFVAPFLQPELEWDFRLPWVRSINVSGHKYGLTYPGVGFAVWRDAEDLPDDLVFRVNYLGGDMPTFTLNFSRPGNQIVGQYYNFIRLGHRGYRDIMRTLHEIATDLAQRIGSRREFELVSDGSATPVFAVRVADDAGFSAFDLSDQLRRHGWQVPAYTMPADAEHVAVLRFVIREGFSADLADLLHLSLDDAVRAARDGGSGPPRTHFAHT
jgi:glutamate decarboxylase